MQSKIRIEHLPKLDKILRVTFSAIKKDLNETKEEFSVLQDEVNSFIDDFRTKLSKTSTTISKEVDTKIDEIDKRFSNKALEIEDQIATLGTSLDKFVKKSNAKTREINNKFKKLDNFYKISDDLNKEIKNLKFLKGEVEKIAVLSRNVEVLENAAVMRNELDPKLARINKRVDKKLADNEADKDFFIKNLQSEFDNEKKSVSNKVKDLINKVNKYNKENKSQISRVKTWHTTSKKNLDEKSKELFKHVNDETENLRKHVVTNSDELRKHIMNETSKLNDNVSNNTTELKNLITEETVKNRSDVEEIKAENHKISKTFNTLVRDKDLNKKLSEYTDLKKITELSDELNKERTIRAELENEVKSIRKTVAKLSKKAKVIPEKPVKVKEDKKEKPIKVKDKNKKGFFQKILDFLIEEVEEDNDKDKRLQEFDRKKDGKFEIKEIKELK